MPTDLLNESCFSLLFSELVRYSQSRVDSIAELENKLAALGYSVGWRALETIVARERPDKREIRLVPALQFVTSSCWHTLFGKNADGLERSTDGADTYLIVDKDPLPARYASVPRDMSRLNLASFSAGVARGLLEAQGFGCTASAHQVDLPQGGQKTVILVKFDADVIERETRIAATS